MLSNPKIGQQVQIWYNKRVAPTMPLHGKIGIITVVVKARKLKNHGVLIDGELYAVPCGNINRIEDIRFVQNGDQVLPDWVRKKPRNQQVQLRLFD